MSFNIEKDKEFNRFLDEHVNPYVEELEERRIKYLSRLKLYLFLAFLLIAALPFVEPYISQSLDYYAQSMHDTKSSLGLSLKDEYQSQEESLTIFIYFYVPIISLFIALLPIFNYRRHTKKIKVGSLKYIPSGTFSFKEIIFSHLLKYFGDFTFKREYGNAVFLDPQNSIVLPEYDKSYCEDNISGVFNDSKIEMSEMKLIKCHKKKQIAAFSGFIIMIDICNSDLKLRGPFDGKTVIIQDDKKHLEYIQKKFKNYERVDLPNKKLEDRFEAFTTNKEEAKAIISKKLLDSILQLADVLNSASGQVTHIDDRVMFFAYRKARLLGSYILKILWVPFGLVSLIRGGAFSGYKIEDFDTSKHCEVYEGESSDDHINSVQAINDDITCSFYSDKVLITVPCKCDLFEPNSIFEPALIKEDITLLFEIMNIVRNITDHICENKPVK